MKASIYIIIFLQILVFTKNDRTKMDEDKFWEVIEKAWEANPDIDEIRHKVLFLEDKRYIAVLQKYTDVVIKSLEDELMKLNKEELTEFNFFVEKMLYEIDRKDIHENTDGSDDGFYYARGFILGVGQEYYNMVKNDPTKVAYDVEFYEMCFIGYDVYKEKFGEEFKRYQHHNASSFMNKEGWKE